MKRILNMMLSIILVIGLMMINYSFIIKPVISVEAPTVLDDHVIVHVPGNKSFTLERGQSIKLYGIKNCTVETYLLGCGWTSHSEKPDQEITFNFNPVFYILPSPIKLEEMSQQHQNFKFRLLAVSAPFWVSSADIASSQRLDSRTPFSIQNAVRVGAYDALTGSGVWSRSNWSDPYLLSDSVCLYNYADEGKEAFIRKLEKINPQVIFIGSMTLSFPGAIQFATIAKERFGNNVFVVLGGKHVNETIYTKNGVVEHHVGSPVILMEQNKISPVFDLVVSGDGEEVVQRLGECLGDDILNNHQIQKFSKYVPLFSNIKGKFILSWIENGIQNLVNTTSLDYESLPSPISLFGSNHTSFPVFEKEITAHVYSDMGKGCVMNCFFCSENNRINGKISQIGDPAQRLYNQLYDASLQAESISAFVEDSILLSGNPIYLSRLANLLETNPISMVFGGQFTIDNLLNPSVQECIQRLAKCGLVYVYTGIETADETIASEFSKNTNGKSWLDRNRLAIEFLAQNNLRYGVSIMWGLGETQSTRLAQLDMIKSWQDIYKMPSITSLNWATQHPLFNQSSFDYISWGTDVDSKYLPIFVKLFGEASEKYILSGTSLPTLSELQELADKISTFV